LFKENIGSYLLLRTWMVANIFSLSELLYLYHPDNNEIFYNMRIRAFFYVFLFLFSLYACTGKKDANSIVGLLYLDGEPVNIKIVDGKIATIKHLSLQLGIPKIYVAPGLIDIQVNGYMGVNFSDQYLTMERMREATMALWKEGATSSSTLLFRLK